MDKINVAIIGYGLSGRIFHSAILNSLDAFKISKIVTQDEKKRILALEENKEATVVSSADDVFTDESIELIVISTPNTSHVKLAEKAMKSGKHVVIEKPFTVTSDEAVKLINISKETDTILSVYQNRRFDGDYKTVKKIIKDKSLARIVEFESHFDRFKNTLDESKWREDALPGSGTLYDLGAHLIDQALDLFGLPLEVYGDIRSQRKGKVDDNFELIMYYPDLKVTLKAGSLVKEKQARFTLLGTEGAYVKFGLDVQEETLLNGLRPFDDTWGVEDKSLWGTINTRKVREKIETERGDYRDYYLNIYNSIKRNEDLIVTAEDGLNVIRIIEAAIKSNAEKRRVVIK